MGMWTTGAQGMDGTIERTRRGAVHEACASGGSVRRRGWWAVLGAGLVLLADRKSTRLNSSHVSISYAVFCLKKKKNIKRITNQHRQEDHRSYTSYEAEQRRSNTR